ncbi:Cytoplasmic protein, partial [Monkeypox virus]
KNDYPRIISYNP